MRRLILAVTVIFLTALPICAEEVIKLWPDGLPEGAVTLNAERVARLEQQQATPSSDGFYRVRVVTDPIITLYKAPYPNGCGIIIFPGGGYSHLAVEQEGKEIAGWLNGLGVTAMVVQYRVPRRDPKPAHAEPLQDAQRAIRLTRQNAEAWGIDPNRVGVLGFSAGGHLTVMAGTHWDQSTYAPSDATDELSCRPDFMVPIYPAYLDDKQGGGLDPIIKVNDQTPPTFMSVTWDDERRGLDAALLFAELKRNNVPAELHIFSKGGHGYGIRPSDNPVQHWNDFCADWLRVSGYLDKK